MVRMRKMTDDDRVTVLSLSVAAEQSAFVDSIADTLSMTGPVRDNYVVLADDTIVGFFQIDCSSGNQRIPHSLEVHEVAIDATHQGKGYGRSFICGLKSFLKHEYPHSKSACLTVNCRNGKAIGLYELGEFVDTGNLYHGGRSGPQHVMRLDLS